MNMFSRIAALIMTVLCLIELSLVQPNQPVHWQFSSDSLPNGEVVLKLTAHLAKGWHLYSQHLREGGPIPTRISFDQCPSYILVGNTQEKGTVTKFYDDTYEMDIIWYSETVDFFQRVRLVEPLTSINGSIEFMVCNDYTCLPSKQPFTIDVKPK